MSFRPISFIAAPAVPSSRRQTLRAIGALAALVLTFALGMGLTKPAHADVIPVTSADLRVDDGMVLLDAEFDFALNSTLEEALQKGVPLYFVLEFELTRARWYWLDATLAQISTTSRISYNALTRQYRVSTGLLAQSFNTLQEVERFVGRATSREVIRVDALTKGARYDAAVRLHLDVAQLPKPFQVVALAEREWTLSSPWQRWTFVP
jgi:Domain of unknown function (DUF4390)